MDEQKNVRVPEKKKNGKGFLIGVIVILLLICGGLSAFIYMNKDRMLSNGSIIVENKSKSKKTEKNISNEDEKKEKVNYDLKTEEYGFNASSVGLSVNVDKTRKSVRISYNGATINNSFGLGWVTAVDTTAYELIDTKTFSKKITQVLIDGFGQDAKGSAIMYLMDDGTIEYVPILKDINTNWSQPDNTKKFNSYGKLDGVSNIISLIPAEASGYHTVLARKVDGTVINLADIFRETGNF